VALKVALRNRWQMQTVEEPATTSAPADKATTPS